MLVSPSKTAHHNPVRDPAVVASSNPLTRFPGPVLWRRHGGRIMRTGTLALLAAALGVVALAVSSQAQSARTVKPVLHGRATGWPSREALAATAGALVFAKGGNAVDAACANGSPLTARCGHAGWGGETQALVYDPRAKKVIGVNARASRRPGRRRLSTERRPAYPARVRAPRLGHAGTRRAHHDAAEYGRLSLKEVLEPAIQWPTATRSRPSSRTRSSDSGDALRLALLEAVFLPTPERRGRRRSRRGLRAGRPRGHPAKLVEAEQRALAAGKSRRRRSRRPTESVLTAGTWPRSWSGDAGGRAASSRGRTSPGWQVKLESR